MKELPETGFLKLKDIIGSPKSTPPIPAIIPIGKNNWYEGIKKGIFPKPVQLSQRIKLWRVEDIRALVEKINKREFPWS